MFSEDYLMRIIRQATIAIARILGYKNAGQYEEATKEIDQTLGILLGMDSEIIRLMDDESIYLLLKNNETIDLIKLEIIADLFKEEGDIQQLQDHNAESKNYFTRSLNYYLLIGLDPEISRPTEIAQKIEDLIIKLGSNDLEENTLWNLSSYYEKRSEFTKAEDMLSKLAAQNDSAKYIIDEIKSFYNRLLEKNSDELAAGGMSRTQIQNELRKLE